MKKGKWLTILLLSLTVFVGVTFARDLNDLHGTWQGKGRVFQSHFTRNSADSCKTDSVNIFITIYKDNRVSGNIGEAEFVDCIVKRNRSWLGRLLNFKTDYIITGGTIRGNIVPVDTVLQKKITIPFNIVDNNIKGTLMQTYKWKYPDPLIRVIVSKK